MRLSKEELSFTATLSRDTIDMVLTAMFRNMGFIDINTTLYFESITFDDDEVTMIADFEQETLQ